MRSRRYRRGRVLPINLDGTGSFSWTPGSADVGSYAVTFAATENNGAGLTTEQTITLTVSAGGGSGGLSGAVGVAPASINLTTEGTADWAHWGLTTASSFDHKAGVTSQISNITPVGSAPKRYKGDAAWSAHSWSDGTPTATQAGTQSMVYWLGNGSGYQLTVPADTAVRTLRLYLGGWFSKSQVVASLSDGSASPLTLVLDDPGGNVIDRVVTLTFSAASAGQTLTVRHTLVDDYGVGNIALQAATLQVVSGNQAPTIDPIGNQAVTEGNNLSFSVTAHDPDGPAPLVLGISNAVPPLPAGASFTDNLDGTGSFSWMPGSADVGSYAVTFAATENNGAGLTTEQTITLTVSAGGGSGGLSGAVGVAPASINLTTEGTADWAHWGLTTASSFDHKAGVTSQISNITPVGSAPKRYKGDAAWSAHSWSDGTPTATQAGTQSMVYWLGNGSGYQLTVPADTTVRTLRLYLGGWASKSQVVASLSDGSAPTVTQVLDDPSNVLDRVVTLTFSAASAGQTLTVRHTLVDDYGKGNIALQAATLDGQPMSSPLPFSDYFSAGGMNDWSVVDQTPTASAWTVASGELHQNNRVESVNAFQESYHLGTYAYLTAGLGWTDYRFSADATYLAKPYAEDIGVMFRYRDPNNYYRLAFNSRYGFTRLEKRVGGQFVPLATNARGYTDGELLHIVIEVKGSSIKVYLNGDPLFAVSDTSLASGTVALYSQDQGKFDNVQVESLTTTPSIVIASPLAHSVLTGSSLTVTASADNVPANGYVEFVLDDGASLTANTPPFTKKFSVVGLGVHKVDAILRNQSDVELARDTNDDISTQGDYLVAVGDSITNGIGDFFAADNTSGIGDFYTADNLIGRIIAFEGYESVLTDTLNATGTYPTNLVFNEGIGGDETYDAAFTRIKSILDRHPTADKALILLGTNDATAAIPPGLGCSGAACNGTFKGNLQTLVDKIRWANYPTNTVPSNITPFVAFTPPAFNSTSPWNSTTNNRIRNYNTVISSEINGIQTGPDFFYFFLPSSTRNYRSLFYNALHPNALGHVMMAYLWHNVLDSANVLPLPFILDDLVASTGALLQQNLIETGDQYYIDETYTLSGGIPSILQNGRWIISNDADRGDSSGNYLSFSVDRPVDIYVAYDGGVPASSLPTWMKNLGFSRVAGGTLSTTDPNTPTLKLYVLPATAVTQNFPSGVVTLGGNVQGTTGATANYVAIVVGN